MILEHLPVADAVDRALLEGAAAWPDVRADADVLRAQLAVHLDGSSVDPRHVSDLYLAAACAAGDPAALAAFESRHMAAMEAPLRAIVGEAHVAEVKQIVRQRLLVARGGREPRIAGYAGKSSLRRWVRACTLRAASTLLRQQQPGRNRDLDWLGVPVEFADPALAQVRGRYGPVFKKALQSALARVSVRDRALLRYSYLEDLSMDEIGRIYGVHRTTALRWIESARRRVLSHLRRTLQRELGLVGRDLESLMRELRSHLDLSLERVLAAAEPATP